MSVTITEEAVTQMVELSAYLVKRDGSYWCIVLADGCPFEGEATVLEHGSLNYLGGRMPRLVTGSEAIYAYGALLDGCDEAADMTVNFTLANTAYSLTLPSD